MFFASDDNNVTESIISEQNNTINTIVNENNKITETESCNDLNDDEKSYIKENDLYNYLDEIEWPNDWRNTIYDDEIMPVKVENISINNINVTDNAVTKANLPIKVNSNTAIFSVNEIALASDNTANYITSKKNLPSMVSTGSKNVNINDLLYLMCKSLSTTSSINVASYSHVSSTSGTNKPGLLFTKNQYLSLDNSIVQCYETNKRNPKNYDHKNVTFCFDDVVYLYSRICAYKYQSGSLAGSVKILALYHRDYSNQEMALQSSSTSVHGFY